jgi:hypothetical protein
VFAGEDVPPATLRFEGIKVKAGEENLGSRGDLLDYCPLIHRVQSGEKVDVLALRPVNVGVNTTTIGFHTCRGQLNGDPLACNSTPYIRFDFNDPTEIADWSRIKSETKDRGEAYTSEVKDGKLWLSYRWKDTSRYIFSYNRAIRNVRLEVKFNITQGEYTEINLHCRIKDKSYKDNREVFNNSYTLIVKNNGEWGIHTANPAVFFHLETSSLIDQGLGSNTVALVCQDNQISFYINGHLIHTVTDDSFQAGSVGIAIAPYSIDRGPITEVNFEYITISEP